MTELRIIKTMSPSLARERSRIYALLSTVFLRQPGSALVEFYRELSGMLKDFPEVMKVEAYLRETQGKSSKEVSEELSTSYTKLFRGTMPLIPPPYESVYKGEQVFGKATEAVLREYRSHGMELREEYRGEPPDYLGFELDFMRFLCEKEAEARKENDLVNLEKLLAAEKGFLGEHLLSWTDKFYEVVKRYDDKGFYSGWLTFAVHWLKQDYKHVSDLLIEANN